MTIAVVTPTLGASPWLGATVESVAHQSASCIHVLVTPASMADELRRRFPRTTVVAEPQPGRGMYAAINSGVAADAGWDAVTYINDDDVLLAAFSQGTARLPPADRAFVAYGHVRLIDKSGARVGGVPVAPWPALIREMYAQGIDPVYQHGTVISRAAWQQLGGFDERFRFCGDSELLARAAMRGVPFIKMRGVEIAAFRLRAGQLTQNRGALEAERKAVDALLGLGLGRRGVVGWWARLVFRAGNVPVYLDRVRRHGFLSFNEMVQRYG